MKKLVSLSCLLAIMSFINNSFAEEEEMKKKESLKKYHEKRNFKITNEPEGKLEKGHKKPIFVIQQHDASHMHYDIRLEMDGVLKSWAVPKGPSLDPEVKRLAAPTEDHPLEYANFEGIIPEHEYGAGPVIIWDKGTYKNISEKNGKPISMEKGYEDGRIEVLLKGKKLQGGFAFIRMKKSSKNLKDKWLLVKMDDGYANRDKDYSIVASKPKSVKSGKTIVQMAEGTKKQKSVKSEKTVHMAESKKKQKKEKKKVKTA